MASAVWQWYLPVPCLPQRGDLWVRKGSEKALTVNLKKPSISRATEVFYSCLPI